MSDQINLKLHSKLNSVHAASGLIKLKNTFYLVADDQLSLASFTLDSTDSIQFSKLLSGELPEDHLERKKQKPDWESLVCLQSKNGCDEILILPSGSKANRTLGMLVKIKDGVFHEAKKIDFNQLYAKLGETYLDLNIEGAAVSGAVLKIFQRGNGKLKQNAIIDLDLNGFIADVENSGILSTKHILGTTEYNLGTIKNVSLTFTDACFCNEHLFFLAAAEASDSTFDDGAYVGAVLGCINISGEVIFQKKLNCDYKPEGLWVDFSNDRYHVFVVTDADNSDIASSLFVGEF